MVKYKYLYQDSQNVVHEDSIAARNRADAYAKIRKIGIRPFRVIGDDPLNWQPWAISAGYLILSAALVFLSILAISQAKQLKELQMREIEDQTVL